MQRCCNFGRRDTAPGAIKARRKRRPIGRKEGWLLFETTTTMTRTTTTMAMPVSPRNRFAGKAHALQHTRAILNVLARAPNAIYFSSFARLANDKGKERRENAGEKYRGKICHDVEFSTEVSSPARTRPSEMFSLFTRLCVHPLFLMSHKRKISKSAYLAVQLSNGYLDSSLRGSDISDEQNVTSKCHARNHVLVKKSAMRTKFFTQILFISYTKDIKRHEYSKHDTILLQGAKQRDHRIPIIPNVGSHYTQDETGIFRGTEETHVSNAHRNSMRGYRLRAISGSNLDAPDTDTPERNCRVHFPRRAFLARSSASIT